MTVYFDWDYLTSSGERELKVRGSSWLSHYLSGPTVYLGAVITINIRRRLMGHGMNDNKYSVIIALYC